MKAILCVAALSGSFSFGQVLFDGDFEPPACQISVSPYPGHVGYQQCNIGKSIDSTWWEVYWGSVYIVNHPEMIPSQVLSINGADSGAVRQTLNNTVAGQKYQLTLSWVPNTFGSSPAESAYMDWNGVNYGRFNDAGGWALGAAPIKTESFVLLAQGNDVVSLVSQNIGPGILFDNISMVAVDSSTPLSAVLGGTTTPVPEPSTYAAAFGVGLVGFGLLRRLRS